MLNQLLQAYKGLMIDSTEPSLIKQLFAEIEQHRAAPWFSRVVGIASDAPDLQLAVGTDEGGSRLKDLLVDGPVLLKFYRGSWCPFCTLELKAYERIASQLKRLGIRLIGVTPESVSRIALTRQYDCPSFDIAHDADHAVAKQFGLTYQAGPAEMALYEHHGATEHLGGANAPDGSVTMALPALYLIEPDGRISYSSMSPDPTVRAEPAELLERIRDMRAATLQTHN